MEKRNLILRAAVAAALGTVAVGAHAVKIDAAGTAVKTYAKQYIKDTTSTVTLVGAVPITLEGTDVFVGRVQPFNVTIALSAGKFGANTSVTANTAGVNSASCLFGTESAVLTKVSGGSGSSYVTYNFSNPSASQLQATCNFELGATLASAAANAIGDGTDVSVSISFSDPTSGLTLGAGVSGAIAKTGSAFTVSIKNTPNSGELIDLSQNALFFNGGVADAVAQGGSFKITANTAAYDNAATLLAHSALSDFDRTITLTGEAFGAFIQSSGSTKGVHFADTSGNAAVKFTTAGATSVTFKYTAGATGFMNSATVNEYDMYYAVPTTNTVAMDEVNTKVTVVIAHPTSGKSVSSGPTAVYPMLKNGWSQKLFFNNASADEVTGYRSYVRITNTSVLNGTLNVTMILDDGTSSTGTLGTLNAGNSKLFTIGQIETAVGSTIPAAGKARFTFNGVFPSGAAVGFMLNPDGTVTNMTPNVQ